MSKQRREAAVKVANSLFETEKALDAALTSAAGFVALLPAARQEARLSATVGQDAIAKAIKALTMLGEAQAAMAEAHDALFKVQGQVGLGEVNFGTLGTKPENASLERPTHQFRVVRSEAA